VRERVVPPSPVVHIPVDLPAASTRLLVCIGGVPLIPEDRPLLSVKEEMELRAVMDVRCRSRNGVHDAGIAVHANVSLHAEVPLVALLRLVHLGVSLAFPVLRGARGSNERGIHDGASPHEAASLLEQCVHDLQEPFLQLVRFEQVPEVEDRCFVGNGVTEEINAEELLEGAAVVDGLLHRGIGEVVPLLQEVDLQHELHVLRGSSDGVVIVVGTDGSEHLPPRNDVIHLLEEPLAAEFLLVGDAEERGLGRHGEQGEYG